MGPVGHTPRGLLCTAMVKEGFLGEEEVQDHMLERSMSPFQSAKKLVYFHFALFQKPRSQGEVPFLNWRAQRFLSSGDATRIMNHGLPSSQVPPNPSVIV